VQNIWRPVFERRLTWASQGVTDEILCQATEGYRATAGVHIATEDFRKVLRNQMNQPEEAASWGTDTVAVMEGLRAVFDAMHNGV
jgi:hypothetical protein